MLIPQAISFQAYRGASFSEQVNFWQDAGHTVPFDFSTWTVTVTATLGTNNLPLHFTQGTGSLTFYLNPSETAAAQPASYHVVVTLTATTGSPAEVEYLASGTLTFQDP